MKIIFIGDATRERDCFPKKKFGKHLIENKPYFYLFFIFYFLFFCTLCTKKKKLLPGIHQTENFLEKKENQA